jgi:hypothetical protein
MKEVSEHYNIFFAKQSDDRSKYRIYINGKITEFFVVKRDIMNILNHIQFTNFVHGDSIFYVNKETMKPYLTETPPENPAKRWEAK